MNDHFNVKYVLPHLVTVHICAPTLVNDDKHVKGEMSLDLFNHINTHEHQRW